MTPLFLAKSRSAFLAPGAVLMALGASTVVLAAPETSKPVASSQAVSSSSKKTTSRIKLKPGVATQVGPKRPKKYILINGKWVELPSGGSSATPSPTPPPVAKGRRVNITARLVITNSDDGYTAGFPPKPDKDVELRGSILFGGQTAFSFNNKRALSGNEIISKPLNSVALRYSDPNHRFFKVSGKVEDIDSGSGNDGLWLASENIDLISIMESNREHHIRGDRDSENADLYIRVTDGGEFFY